jgi:multiple sugar transport system substrate-binding protein/raffinose/stachyose/melibiose transport system substrate-binding protein
VFKRGAALGIGASALSTVLAARSGAVRAQGGGVLNIASNASDPEPRRVMEELTVPGFEQASGIQVELNTVNHEDFKQAIRTYLASDDPPDVLTWFAGNRMRFFVERELVAPVTDVYEQEGWVTEYPDGILAVSRGADDQYYFVPTNYYWWAIYYRPSLFQQARIEAPPENWEQFLAAVDALKEAEITPITIGTKAPWPAAAWFDYLNMRVNGPEFHVRLTDGQVPYTSPEVKNVFARWRELLDREAFIQQPEALEWQDALTPMVNGEAAMYLMGQFVTDSYPDDGEADLDFFRFPLIEPNVPVGEDAPTDGYFMSAKAANPEAAKEFLAYVGGEEYQTQTAQELGRIAVHTGVPLDVYEPQVQKGVNLLQNSDYLAQFYDRDTHPEMADAGMEAFVQFMNNPDDIDQILESLDRERERVFAADE